MRKHLSQVSKPGPTRPVSGLPARSHGLARVLSKLGACSRSRAEQWVRAGRVSVDGEVVRDPERRTGPDAAIAIDGVPFKPGERVYIVLNKPRGTVVSASDERGRATVYDLLGDAGLPWLAPVGRLDKASEGLLLMGNDPEWAARITDPASHLAKTYHVQVRGVPDAKALEQLRAGVTDNGEKLSARAASLLRRGERNAWLEIVLDQGRNRQIRRMLAALDYDVLRLVRVAIGPLALGDLAKGAWRPLSADEIKSLAP